MKRSIILAAVGFIAVGAAGPAGGLQQEARGGRACYIGCQVECYSRHPGGGPGWEQCYVACAQARCGMPT